MTTQIKFPFLAFLLLPFFSAEVLAVFGDTATLNDIQQAQTAPPFNGRPQAEVERIFAHPNGPLLQVMNALPRLFTFALFTAFREYFATGPFSPNRRNPTGQGDRLLVLLGDNRLLPTTYLPGTGRVANAHFVRLSNDWTEYLAGSLLPPEGVGVVQERAHPPEEHLMEVPPMLGPLFLLGQEEAIPYGHLKQRFLGVYVRRYPTTDTHRRQKYFNERYRAQRLRLAVLQALYWMLVVRPFLGLVADNPGLLDPAINFMQMMPAAIVFVPPPPAPPPPIVPPPVEEAPEDDFSGNCGHWPFIGFFPFNSSNLPPFVLFIFLFHSFLTTSFFNLPSAFGDTVTIRTITDRLLERQIFRRTIVSVDHFFAYSIARRRPDGPLHRVMTAEPRLFAAVLFTLFQERFAVSTCFAYSKNT